MKFVTEIVADEQGRSVTCVTIQGNFVEMTNLANALNRLVNAPAVNVIEAVTSEPGVLRLKRD